ncbi:hypothetical protein NM208_g9421 [Fusarium decemcellulare]|uniref:Uncharacterized protein n=1 Tax=Fusarium decemcellulare TaxID=57161 RepID=A0ACC1S1T8_9HYPO|nr:hypothetical protein NM208_g9421 [Fusarium decemcellulare]
MPDHHSARRPSTRQQTARSNAATAVPHHGVGAHVVMDHPSSEPALGPHENADAHAQGYGSFHQYGYMRNGTLPQEQPQDMNSFLQAIDSRFEAQGSGFHHMAEQCLAQVCTTLENGVKHLFGSHLTSQIAQLEGQLQASAQEKEQLQSQNKHLANKNRNLERQLQESNKKLAKALEERDEQRRLADGSTLADSSKATNDVVQSKWKQLGYNIRSLAKALAKLPAVRPEEEHIKQRFRDLSVNWCRQLFNEDYREFIIHGYLWSLVDRKLFDGTSGIWCGTYGQAFKTMREQIVECFPRAEASQHTCMSLAQGARWVVQGSAILEYIWAPNQKALDHLLDLETQHLMSLCRIPAANTTKIANQIFNEFQAIVDVALELDQIFMRSKAFLVVRWPDASKTSHEALRYDADRMDAVGWEKDLCSESEVKLVLSPVLWKIGNADGQRYDTDMILCKALVVCN